MAETLFAKTFIILGSQLFVTWAITVLVIRFVRYLYYAKVPGVTAVATSEGGLDLDLDWDSIKVYFYLLLIVDVGIFIFLLFKGRHELSLGVPLFTLWSILTGIELGLALISVDENLGGKVLSITASISFLCAIIGIYSGVDFAFLGKFLCLSLLFLIIANLIRLFINIPRATQRIVAFFGVVVFTGYLLYDFNKLAKLNERADANTWYAAMDMSIEIYLDIINLFLDLLDLLS